MIYDAPTRRFIFDNKTKLQPSALVFYDLPRLLSAGEEICPEVEVLAQRLPQADFAEDFATGWDADALPHQLDPIKWASMRKGSGVIAYGMGLGKTFIAVRTMRAIKRSRILIICQAHLKHNWEKEIRMWEPDKAIHICSGRDSDFTEATYTIINWNIVQNNADALLKIEWDQIIIDESHKCGGWGSKAYDTYKELAKAIRKRGGGFLLMTGTLFKNSPMDAHTALYLLDPLVPGGRGEFEARFDPIGKMKKEVIGMQRRANTPRWLIGKKWGEIKKLEKAKGTKGDVHALRWLLSQYVITKTYFEVFPDDGKNRETKFISVDLNLTTHQRRVMSTGAMVDGGEIKGELATILRLVAEMKAPFVADYVESWLEAHDDQKVVIACWHISAREIIAESLATYGVVEIRGTAAQKKRAEAKFKDDPSTRVCLLNIESGGTGLNLVTSSHLVFSEVPWTAASYDQVKARIDRIGQDSDQIQYTVFLAADTPEGAKFGTVRQKSGLNAMYLEGH